MGTRAATFALSTALAFGAMNLTNGTAVAKPLFAVAIKELGGETVGLSVERDDKTGELKVVQLPMDGQKSKGEKAKPSAEETPATTEEEEAVEQAGAGETDGGDAGPDVVEAEIVITESEVAPAPPESSEEQDVDTPVVELTEDEAEDADTPVVDLTGDEVGDGVDVAGPGEQEDAGPVEDVAGEDPPLAGAIILPPVEDPSAGDEAESVSAPVAGVVQDVPQEIKAEDEQ